MRFLSANRVYPDTIRRRAARLLAAKTALACRADYFRYHNPICQEDANRPIVVDDDERLKTGAYGNYLSKTIQNSLTIWAECNGVHPNRTSEAIKVN